MTESPDTDHAPSFAPVPLARARSDDWHPEVQRNFVRALSVMASVGPAARAVCMSRASAYRLRDRPGAESFAAAWDIALGTGRARMFDYAMERAVNGVTVVRILRGGSVTVSGGPDMALVNAALRDRNLG